MSRLPIIIFILLSFYSANAAESMVDWVNNNVSRNPLIQASFLEIEEIETKSQIAKTWQSPNIHFSYGSLYGISVSQPLPVLGKQNFLSQIYEEELAIARLKHQLLYRQLVQQITVLAFELKIIDSQYAFEVHRQKKLELAEAFLRSRPIASPQVNAQAQIVKQQIKKVESELLELQSQRDQLKEKLAFYQANTAVPEIGWLKAEKDIFAGQNLTEDLNHNDDLLILEKNLMKLGEEKKLMAAENWSDPVLSGSYDQPFSTLNEKTYFLGLGINLPVWGGNRALVDSIDKKIMRERIEIDYQKHILENELKRAVMVYQIARQRAQLYHPLKLTQTTETFDRLERDFKKELIDLLTFIELDKQIADTASLTFQAQRALVDSISKIARLTGRNDLPELLVNQ